LQKRAIYPGTFDPITVGHTDIIKRACKIFDEVIVAVAESKSKKPMFTHTERIEFAKEATREYPKVKVIGFDELLVNLCEREGVDIVIRGLRAVSDFEYELQMGYANSSLKRDLETIYLMPSLEYAFVSSSIVRAILAFEGEVEHLLPPQVYELIKRRD